MAFFEQIGKRLTDAGQGVKQQTKNLTDVTKLSLLVSEKEKAIAQRYSVMGQAYYESHKDSSNAELQSMIDEINALMAEISQHQEEIKQIKGFTKCPCCGTQIPAQAAYCNTCGSKVHPNSPEPPTRICPACHEPVNEDNLFCNHCGAKLDSAN